MEPRNPPPPASEIIVIGAFDAAATPSGPSRQAPSSSSLGATLMVAAGLRGVAMLAWWAVAFHRSNTMLWIVPAGLALLGSPVLACLSVFASGPKPSAAPADLGSKLATNL
jgi:hypothetical protein